MIVIIIIIIIFKAAYLLVVKISFLDKVTKSSTSVVEYTKTFNTIVANEKIAVPMP